MNQSTKRRDMVNYVKVIRLSGSFFAREFVKKEKVRKNIKYREVDEKTVAQQFKDGDTSVEIIFEDSKRESILLTNESDVEMIRKYLGEKFL
ncbi:MAG: hypothetical protein ACOZCL_06925 [Bacillota bacterium]